MWSYRHRITKFGTPICDVTKHPIHALIENTSSHDQGRAQGESSGVNPPPFELDICNNFITFARILIVFVYLLLVNLST